jgi:16S rRNA processing protein RimM
VAALHSPSKPKAQKTPQSAQPPQNPKQNSNAPGEASVTSTNVTVARILRPHGVRGEVAAEILTDFPDRLTKLKSAELWDGKSEPRRVAVRSCWLSTSRGGQAIFYFAGSDTMTAAENLVGLEVQISLADRMPLPASSYYISDLIGCEVYERASGTAHDDSREKAADESVGKSQEKDASLIGRVRDVQSGGTPILVVDSAQGELLIPLAQEICVYVDTAARRIEVILPEGLRELNRP